MIHPAPESHAPQRRQEITRCLHACGLLSGTRRWSLRRKTGDETAPSAERLRHGLMQLGPVFSAFGRYLGSRVDVFSVQDCLIFSAIPDRLEASPFLAVQELITRQLACPIEQAFFSIEDTPFESRLLFQSHRAFLHNGQPVVVNVIHPELDAWIERDTEQLALLDEVLANAPWRVSSISALVVDFHHSLREQVDFAAEADAFTALADETHDSSFIPRVYPQLSRSHVLTAERLPGKPLRAYIPPGTPGSRPEPGDQSGVSQPHTLVRTLCVGWMRSVFIRGLLPVIPDIDCVQVLPDERIVLTNSPSVTLPSESRMNLWHYLLYEAAHDPDKAFTSLLQEMEPSPVSLDERLLRNRFRQAVPFRDGGWSPESPADSLAEHLFVHWQVARQYGYRPRLHLIRLYQGLFRLASIARQLTPESDALSASLDHLRVAVSLSQFQDLLRPDQWGVRLPRYVAQMLSIPGKLDETLRLLTQGDVKFNVQVVDPARPDRERPVFITIIALTLVLVAIPLIARSLAGVFGPWGQRISALVFLGVGLLLLRLVSRRR